MFFGQGLTAEQPQEPTVTAPAAPQPSVSPGGDDAMGVDPQTIQLLQHLQQQVATPRRKIVAPPVTSKAKHGSMVQNIGLNALSMFVPFVGAAVQKSVKANREEQINQALNTLGAINDELEMADYIAGGDPAKRDEYLNSSPRLQAIFSDKKIAKQLSKVFGGDLLNPEKQNTVFHEAISRHIRLKGEANKMRELRSMVEQQAAVDATTQMLSPQQPKPETPKDQLSIAQKVGTLPMRLEQPDPIKSTHMASTLKQVLELSGEASIKTPFHAGYRALTEELGRKPTTTEVVALQNRLKDQPIDDIINQGITLAMAGKTEEAQQLFSVATLASKARRGATEKKFGNKIELIGAALGGNKEAQAIYAQMRADEAENARSRGMGYGAGRAMYTFQTAMDGDTGEMILIPTMDMIRGIKEGKNYIPVGKPTGKDAISVQQLVSEAGPRGTRFYEDGAIKQVEMNVGAFDNAKDRVIFSKAVRQMGQAERGREHVWMSNVIDQALQGELSPEGRRLAISLRRLAETMGRLRTTLGLPATDSSMALTMSLLPGPTTPDAKFARDQIDQLDAMVRNAVEIPMLKGIGLPGSKTPPKEPTQLDKALDKLFGPPKKP